MTGLPAHTPYSGSSIPFTIGLRPAVDPDWLEIDGHYCDSVAEKDRLIAELPQEVFAAEPDTGSAQAEAAEVIETAHRLRIGKLPSELEDSGWNDGSTMSNGRRSDRCSARPGWSRRTSSSCGAARRAGVSLPRRSASRRPGLCARSSASR